MKKLKITIAILCLLTLLISVGMVSAYTFDNYTDKTFFMGPMNKNFEKTGVWMGGCLNSIKENLGLPEDATQEQIQEAKKEKMESLKQERLSVIKEKLGLPEDASEDEVLEALNIWREENKELIMGLGMRGRQRGHGLCRGACPQA